MSTDPSSSPSSMHKHKETVQDTIISVVIAFTLAFVFRGFVVEAFVIPTGSMAPTLMGAHERIRSPETGYEWAVGPWYGSPGAESEYKPIQGQAPDPRLQVHDPMTGELITRANVPRKSGDRILVLKYLYMIMEPERFDVVVFKCPYNPKDNFIKRLIGLPNEEIAIIDGDVFFRPAPAPETRMKNADGSLKNPWADADWKIARKPHRVQEAAWQTVFNSDYAPRNSVVSADRTYSTPWKSEQATDWTIEGRRYEYKGTGRTDLEWDSSRLRYRFRPEGSFPQIGEIPPFDDFWEVNDRYAYNEIPQTWFQHAVHNPPLFMPFFPVSDLRMSAGIEPGSGGTALHATASLVARSHEFQMVIAGSKVTLRMRRVDATEWKTIDEETIAPFAPGRVVNVEFVHVDQAVEAWIDGKKVASGEYNWGPDERIRMSTARTLDDLLKEENGSGLEGDLVVKKNIFEDRAKYLKPRIRWTFEGASVTLHRVRVDRDLYYTSSLIAGSDIPSRGSTPKKPVLLNEDQFFVCGDNSPASLDARVWFPPYPWVKEIDPTEGVVPRKLMLGKAFFVYYPAPTWVYGRIPVPDFGRMRFIW